MRVIFGITGASGSVLAKKALEFLADGDFELNIVITENGRKVFAYELGESFEGFINSISGKKAAIIVHDNSDLFAGIASGSRVPEVMIIMPCSMTTLSKIATGTGDNLLCRSGDCCLKERVRLVICPRETPLSSIHLRNMLTLSDIGAMIVPPVPIFYARPESYEDVVNGIVGRVLKSAGIDNNLYSRWRTHD